MCSYLSERTDRLVESDWVEYSRCYILFLTASVLSNFPLSSPSSFSAVMRFLLCAEWYRQVLSAFLLSLELASFNCRIYRTISFFSDWSLKFTLRSCYYALGRVVLGL